MPIITNPELLSTFHIPKKVLYRAGEFNQLSNNLSNSVNTFLWGPCGSGKTTLIKRAMAEFNSSRKGHAVYIDCAIYPSTYSILKEIIPRSELVFYRSNYELIRELRKYVKNNKFVVFLDNFEHLKDRNLIARFMSLRICVVLISDIEESFAELDMRIRSNIPSVIRLPNYTIEQSFNLIKNRAEEALTKFSYTDAVLKKIAGKINGNITLGLNALKAVALKSESQGKRVIDESDIHIENDYPNPKLTTDEKVILGIMQELESLPSSRLYTLYTEKSRHPKGERAFRNYMKSLCSKGLVKAIGEKRGRVFEFIGGENVQGHN